LIFFKEYYMNLPLLTYTPSSQNQRVANFDMPGDEQPRRYATNHSLGNPTSLSAAEMEELIVAAYRQIFNEQQMIQDTRQVALESKLKKGEITVKDFITGLATSDNFRRRNYDTNNNYRFAQMCVQRILGRDVYSDREKMAWSTVIATKGLNGFIQDLVNSEEYMATFGNSTVPYQRRRVLAQRNSGELPFNRMARYDEFYKAKLPKAAVVGAGMTWGKFERITIAQVMEDANWSRVGALVAGSAILIGFMGAIAALSAQ
jgi:phycobilisome rod-core linker protein